MTQSFDLQAVLGRIDLSGAAFLVERGGPVVVLIGLLSIVALAAGLAKLWQFVGHGVGGGRGIEASLQAWAGGDANRATAALSRHKNPSARVLLYGMTCLLDGQGEAVVREDVERAALRALAELRRYLRVIEATAQVAPLLGLFGTVIGMMRAFQALQASGAEADPAALAGGIWVALITTAVGLAVAMPASLVLYWFEGRIERERSIMEDALTRLFTQRPDGHHAAGAETHVVPLRASAPSSAAE
jgi:biopolymer transport protein ExbB